MEQLGQAATELKRQLETEQAKQAAQVEIAKMKAESDYTLQVKLQSMKDATSIRVAEIGAAVKGYAVEAGHIAAHEQQAGAQVHEAALTIGQQEHAAEMADKQHQQALEQGQVQHGQELETAGVQHQQGMEAESVQHAHALEQGQQATEGQIAVTKAKPAPMNAEANV
jgi:hypothetical protein